MISLHDSTEVRLVKLELSADHQEESLLDLEHRTNTLEDRHSEQVNILGQLSQTVGTLTTTVSALHAITEQLSKSHTIVKVRFDYVIGLLSLIGAAIITGLIGIFFK